MAGTNRRTLSDYERGVTVAQESIIDRLIEVLGLLGNSPEWDKDVEILAPAILSLIQLIQAERRPSAVRSSVEALVAFLKTPHVVDEPGDVID